MQASYGHIQQLSATDSSTFEKLLSFQKLSKPYFFYPTRHYNDI